MPMPVEKDKRSSEDTNLKKDYESSKRLRKNCSQEDNSDIEPGEGLCSSNMDNLSNDGLDGRLSMSIEQKCTLSSASYANCVSNNTMVDGGCSVAISSAEKLCAFLASSCSNAENNEDDSCANMKKPATVDNEAQDNGQSCCSTKHEKLVLSEDAVSRIEAKMDSSDCDKTVEELIKELEDEVDQEFNPGNDHAQDELDSGIVSPIDEQSTERVEAAAIDDNEVPSPEVSDHDTDDNEDEISATEEEPSSAGVELVQTSVDNRKKLPRSWHSYNVIRKREYGNGNRYQPAWFRYAAMGSLYMVERLELMYKLDKHDGCVNCLHFNQSGTRLASGSDDTCVNIWDWATGESLLNFDTGHRSNVFQVKFMPLSGDCHLVTCARDGQVRLVELSVRGICKNTRKLAQHKGAAHKLSIENESPHVFLSCGEDAVVYQIDLRDPTPGKLLTCKNQSDRKVALYSIHHNPMNSNYYVVSGRDQFCRVYDRRQQPACLVKYCPPHLVNVDSFKANVTCCVYNHNGSEVLATYNDEDIYTFDAANAEPAYTHRYKGHRNNATVKGVNYYGASCEYVVSGSDDGYVYFWHKDSEQIVNFLPADEGGVVNCLEPHPTCPVIATSGLDHDVKIWVPSCEEQKFDIDALTKLTNRNLRDRRRESRRYEGHDAVDSQMLWYFISRMQRMRRRIRELLPCFREITNFCCVGRILMKHDHLDVVGGGAANDNGGEVSASDNSSSDENHSDSEGSPHASIQCRTS